MISISCTNITKYYGVELILKDISFSANYGDRIGLIGKNGAGKTTLFNILSGELSYDSGNVFYAKNSELGYLKQQSELHSDSTMLEHCYKVFEDVIQLENQIRDMEHKISKIANEHLDVPKSLLDEYHKMTEDFEKQNGYAIKSHVKGVLNGLGFKESDFNRQINSLSGGQRARLNIARLLLTKPDILFLDEPTNHLDINAVEWLETYLKSYNGTIIIVSHDRYFLDEVVNRIIEIENTKCLMHDGSYSDFIKFKTQHKQALLSQYEKQQKEIQKQTEIIRRFKSHGTEKLAKRALSREKALDKMQKLEKPQDDNKKAKIRFVAHEKSGNEVLHVKDLSKSFNDNQIFKNVTMDIYANDIVGLIGSNGVGKSTILKILTEQISATSGEFKLGHNVLLSYYDQEHQNLNEKNNIFEEISDKVPLFSNTEIRNLLGSFLFVDEDVFKTISSLSGGEKARVSLLKLMLSKSNFLILDEPTNHLDIISKEALEDALQEFDGTILVVSHDRYFLNKVCSKILHLEKDGITEYHGNYDYYIEKRNSMLSKNKSNCNEPGLTKTQIKEARKKEKEQKAKQKKQKQEIERIELEIHNTEEQISELELQLCDESVYNDHTKAQEITSQIENMKTALQNLYEIWEKHL